MCFCTRRIAFARRLCCVVPFCVRWLDIVGRLGSIERFVYFERYSRFILIDLVTNCSLSFAVGEGSCILVPTDRFRSSLGMCREFVASDVVSAYTDLTVGGARRAKVLKPSRL